MPGPFPTASMVPFSTDAVFWTRGVAKIYCSETAGMRIIQGSCLLQKNTCTRKKTWLESFHQSWNCHEFGGRFTLFRPILNYEADDIPIFYFKEASPLGPAGGLNQDLVHLGLPKSTCWEYGSRLQRVQALFTPLSLRKSLQPTKNKSFRYGNVANLNNQAISSINLDLGIQTWPSSYTEGFFHVSFGLKKGASWKIWRDPSARNMLSLGWAVSRSWDMGMGQYL